MVRELVVFGLLSQLIACTPSKPTGFGLPDSPIHYKTVKFADDKQLAEVNGIKITTSQILDKSPVIKDLDQQRTEALIAMTYLKAVEKAQAAKIAKGTVTVFMPATEKPLAQMLARFDRQPTPGFDLAYGKGAKGEEIGQVGSVTVERKDLDENNGVLQSIEKRRYTEVVSQLNQQLSRILLNEEAMKAQKPMQEYIDSVVLKGQKSTVSEDELKAHLKKIGFAESELTPELKTQFESSLAQQKEQRAIEAYIADRELKEPVAVSFHPPTTSIHLSDKWKPIAGADDAPIAMVAFAGTTCPDCPEFTQTLKRAMDKYDGYVKLNWIHNFNPEDGVARMMAQAALCLDAEKQGASLQFLNDFSEKGVKLEEAAFYEWVQKHGIDEKTFRTCFVGQQENEVLTQHLQYAKQVGIVANPTLWIEGELLEGIVRAEDIDRAVNEQIAEKQVSPISAFFRKLSAKFRSH